MSLFRAKMVQQRALLPREDETWLPDCGVAPSHTRWELTTWADFQLCLHRLLMSTGCKSSHSSFLDISHSNGVLRISGWIGQLSCLTIFSTSLSVAPFLCSAGGSMFESTGSDGRGVERRVPEMRRMVEFNCTSTWLVWAERDQTGDWYLLNDGLAHAHLALWAPESNLVVPVKLWTEPLMTGQRIQQEAICYQWFKQRLILSVSKPSISQRSQIKEDTRRTLCACLRIQSQSIRHYNLAQWSGQPGPRTQTRRSL